jgi:uncharacterized integral membrane protein
MGVNSAPEGARETRARGAPTVEPGEPPATAAPTADVGARHGLVQPAAMRRTRLGGLWVVAVLGAVILILLLVFILQNGAHVEIHLFGAHVNAPLGVALLMAAALGVLLVVVPGGGRILQLKRAARGLHRDRMNLADQLDRKTAASPTPTGPRANSDDAL